MKLKKLLISASAIAAGSGLLATVLTSCSKPHIDEDLKIKLDDEGRFVNFGEQGAIDYHDALKNALGRSTGWTQFKTALAEEIVYQWYENRAASDKKSDDKNKEFRNNLEDWKYDIKKDYDNIVDDCKSKYGANWKFYLQNEHLAQNGGTEDAYKHTKLVQKVKTAFIDKVFTTNYFGMRGDLVPGQKFPIFYTPANMTPSRDKIGDPANWPKYGFFARTNTAYNPTNPTVKYLAQNPDGEYATIQDYVFNRWFDTEKPFFSAAALFKYSAPAQSGGKLDNIYNADWATIPEKPNEAFPFFGATSPSNGSTGTRALWEWYNAMLNAEFETDGLYGDDRENYNGTITIDTALTEDSQTLLLCTANDMFTGLYTPYAVAAANLYDEMFDTKATPTVLTQNTLTQAQLTPRINPEEAPIDNDDFRLLSCFFYTPDTWTTTTTINSFIDLNDLYGNAGTNIETDYHCPIFKRNDDYTFLYGDMNKTAAGRNGVRYVTNHFEVPLKPTLSTAQGNAQPWIFEMNEAGVHAQTIDGYQYVRGLTGTETKTVDAFKLRLKDVVKYRLMEDKCYDESNLISADLFGSDDSAKLKSYFKDHFDDIILEMAMIDPNSAEGDYNIFRKVEDFLQDNTPTLLFKDIVNKDNVFGTWGLLSTYLTATIDVDRRQRILSSIESADSKIFEYRKTQIENSKSDRGKKRFENGLLAPIPLEVEEAYDEYGTTHHYDVAMQSIILGDKNAYTTPAMNTPIDRKFVYGLAKDIMNEGTEANPTFIGSLNKVGKNLDKVAYSPQIAKAKDVDSNRFWYWSPIVDQVMYSSMGKSTLANAIKQATYQQYSQSGQLSDEGYTINDIIGLQDPSVLSDVINDGIKATYIANKMLSGTNFAAYTDDPTDNFYSVMYGAYENKMGNATTLNGEFNDDNLNYWLFLSTVAYLAKDGFKKFYDSLASKIHENELAYVAYVSKYDELHKDKIFPNGDPTQPVNSWYTPPEPAPTVTPTPYDWSGDVDNMFDRLGYTGGNPIEEPSWKPSFDQYWNVVYKDVFVSRPLAGFMGIQSASSNSFDEASGLKKAATENFEVSTYKSPDNTSGFVTTDVKTYEQNDGVLFPWAFNGEVTPEIKQKYTFKEVKDPDDSSKPGITIDSFLNKEGLQPAIKLAYNIAQCSTIDDLKTMANSLSEAIYGQSTFSKIVQGEIPISPTDAVQDLKYIMLSEILGSGEETQIDYKHYFKRLVNVELHTDISIGGKYCFRDQDSCYKVMLTQLNKSDLVDKLITPKFTPGTGGQLGTWTMNPAVGLTLEEFWYIFFNAACDSTNQQSAISDAVKKVYGDAKLVVYDAQLYNQFDATWIKDWVKKPMGD